MLDVHLAAAEVEAGLAEIGNGGFGAGELDEFERR